jgi:hypothetical protein
MFDASASGLLNKRTSSRLFAAIAGLGIGAIALAAETKLAVTQPTSAPSAKIEAAIKALSSDSWKERQAAQDVLVTLGDEIVPRLRKLATQSGDEEVRTRAGAALRQIEENAHLGPSIVTLHLKDAKPQDVFAALGKQAHCEFPTWPRNLFQQNVNNTLVTLDYDHVDFWTVFKDACQKSGVFPQQIGNERGMSLQQGSSSYWNGPSVTSGPFLIVANRIYRSNSIDLANPGNVQHDFQLGLCAFAEPKIKVVQSSYNVHVDEAVDDRGNSLVSESRMYDGMSNGQQWMWNLTANLNYPDPDKVGKTIKRFKGKIKFLVQTKSETLDVPDILNVKNLQKTVAHRRMLIKECKKNGEQYEVQMTLYRDAMSQQDWQSIQNPGYTVRLLDKEGHSLSANGWGGGGGVNEMTYNWNFTRNSWGGEEGKIGEPHRLVWEIPLETRETDVAFEFKDLPMP